jgi:hypothetical protein
MNDRQGNRARLQAVAATVLLLGSAAAFSADFPPSVMTPGKVPERIILGFPGDPARSQAVTWRTAKPLDAPQAQIAPWIASPSFGEKAQTVPAISTQVGIPGGTVYHHRAIFSGLEPATFYAYRVGDGIVWSEWSHLQTASAGTEPFRFIYLGDAQNGVKSLWSRTVRAAYAHAPDARFIVLAGDIVNEGYDEELWGELCAGLGFISAEVPLLVTPGNHDLHEDPATGKGETVSRVQAPWHAHLTMPGNGPQDEPLRGTVWSLDYQGMRLTSLNANVYAESDFDPLVRETIKDVQPKWLDTVLAASPARWQVLLQHEALYPVAKNRNYPALRAAIVPTIERHRVDLVLQGHDHRYARTHKVAADRVVLPTQPGTIYTISISGPKLNAETAQWSSLITAREGDAQAYQIISVSRDLLRYEAYTVTGTLLDAFELVKDAAGASTYVNLAPAQPPTPQPDTQSPPGD